MKYALFYVLVVGAVLGLVVAIAPAEARGSRPTTLTGVVNTNYLPANLPAGFTFMDGSKTSSSAYVTALCEMTTLRCVVQSPSPYAGKAFVVYKNTAGKYVPKQ